MHIPFGGAKRIRRNRIVAVPVSFGVKNPA
jgi:hypothetical protein